MNQINSGDEVKGTEVALQKVLNYISSTGINSPEKMLKVFQMKLLDLLGCIEL